MLTSWQGICRLAVSAPLASEGSRPLFISKAVQKAELRKSPSRSRSKGPLERGKRKVWNPISVSERFSAMRKCVHPKSLIIIPSIPWHIRSRKGPFLFHHEWDWDLSGFEQWIHALGADIYMCHICMRYSTYTIHDIFQKSVLHRSNLVAS